MQLADSHCHLDCLDLANHQGSLSAAIDAARENHVHHFLCVCIDLENFPKVLKIAESYPNIHATLGLHPNTVCEEEPTQDLLMTLAKHPKIRAIGETGLDYYRTDASVDWQRDRFRTHIRAARQLKLPLVIHTRDAEKDTIKLMIEEGADQVGGVLHCFTGSWEMAQAALNLGFHISFSGIVTFKNAKNLQEIAKKVPLDRILIETDAPYLAPIPFRGKPNEPAYLKHVAEFLADLRGIPIDSLAQTTTENYFNLFGIKRNEAVI